MVQQVPTMPTAEYTRFRDMDFGDSTSMQRSVVYLRRTSWGAIFAGAVIAIVTHMMLSLLGAGIGLVTMGNEPQNQPSAGALSTAAGVWMAISALISLFIGGLVAGRLSGVALPMEGILHGLAVWAVTTLFSIYIITTSAASLAGGALSTLGQAAQTPQGQQAIQRATEPGSAGGQGQPGAPGTQNGAANQPRPADNRPLSEQPAGPSTPQGRETARQAGTAAIWAFIAMIIGACAAALGGTLGRRFGGSWDRDTLMRLNRPGGAGAPMTGTAAETRRD